MPVAGAGGSLNDDDEIGRRFGGRARGESCFEKADRVEPALMRLLLFSNLYRPEPTGVGPLSGGLADAMARDGHGAIGRATSELQSLMRNSYAGFCLKKKK